MVRLLRSLFCVLLTAFFISNVTYAGVENKDSGHDESVIKQNISLLKKRTKQLKDKIDVLQRRLDAEQRTSKRKNQSTTGHGLDSLVELYAHGPAVVTSPSFGVRRAVEDPYGDETECLTELSSTNEDLVLLNIRKKIHDYSRKNNIEMPSRPIIAISGDIEGLINYQRDYDSTEKMDIDLTAAQLDIIGEVTPWITSAIIMNYDSDKITGGTRVSNSKLKLDRGFVTIGRLNKSPLYFTIGQFYVPFGRYSSNMVTKPSTKNLGRTKARSALIGYSKEAFNVQLYAFSGETGSTGNGATKNILGHTGVHIGNNYKIGQLKFDVEGSVISNIAESDGFQKRVFNSSEDLHSRVWGVAGIARLKYDPFALSAEYVGAARRFDPRDVSFNGAGARPQALNVEGSISFQTLGKPSTFAVGGGRTWQALALQLPRANYFVEYDIEYFKGIFVALEYNHAINYGRQDTYTTISTPGGGGITGGIHRNTVTAKLYVYF